MTSAIICVSASVQTLNNDDEFDHLSKHALACNLEKDFVDVSNGSEFVFETINEVLILGKWCFTKRWKHTLNETRHEIEVARTRQLEKQSQKLAASSCSFEHRLAHSSSSRGGKQKFSDQCAHLSNSGSFEHMLWILTLTVLATVLCLKGDA